MSTWIHINKQSLRHKIRANRHILFRICVFCLLVTVVLSLLSRENSDNTPLGIPAIAFIETTEKIYTVTVNITGGESVGNIQLLGEICRGFNIKPTFFVTGEWLENNQSTGDLLKQNGNVALLCIDTVSMSRNELMRYVALQNDVFHRVLSIYPKYVREMGSSNSYMGEVLSAYGQYYISQSNQGDRAVVSGDILALTLANKEEIYAFASLVTTGLKNGLTAVDMKDFLNEYQKNTA